MKTFLLLALALATACGGSDCAATFVQPGAPIDSCPKISAFYDSKSDTSSFEIDVSPDDNPGYGAGVGFVATGQLTAMTYDSTNTLIASAGFHGSTLADHTEGTPVVVITSLGTPTIRGNLTIWPQIHGTFSADLSSVFKARLNGKF